MIGRVGDDDAGKSLRAALEGAGVETSGVVVSSSSSTTKTTTTTTTSGKTTSSPPPTGTAVIMLQPDGENSIVIVGGANVEGWGEEVLGKSGGSEADSPSSPSSSFVSVSPAFGALLLQREIPEAVNAAYARAAVASGVPVVLGEVLLLLSLLLLLSSRNTTLAGLVIFLCRFLAFSQARERRRRRAREQRDRSGCSR